ncbi:MAG TPA: serine/threonine-protein kinase [Pyrinomonadaceae bacterium]|nr:serine/threonine-protein kinase [Pyrinomonadaceae bacterium]
MYNRPVCRFRGVYLLMLTPETILQGRYRIVRQLGQGGMGAVYEAIDQRLDTTVALKETLFSDERLRKQFEREARLLARLHHPALPRVSDHFSEGDGQFLVMQFIPGDDLAEKMTRRRGPFPADQVLTWADQLLDALDYLHTQDPQIVHRDIKPQNLKLTPRGQIILLDFGLAKGQAGDISRVTTGASIFGYTPNYAPLEQIQGLGTDSRSDLYALGATLYHLMTGVKPPDALTRAAALVNGQPDPLAPASVANPAVPPDVDVFLAKAMAQNRDQRYATADDMRKGLQASDSASTVVPRGEAQTMLFPPSAESTIAAPTKTAVRQETVRAGETTVVRPLTDGGKKRALPLIASVAALVLLACGVLGFFAFRNRSESPVINMAPPSPSPAATQATRSPTAEPSPDEQSQADEQDEEEKKSDAPVAKKPARSEEAERKRRQAEADAEARADAETQTHEEEPRVDPQVPNPPRVPRVRVPQTQVLPGGVTIRKFPDGSQMITTPDGNRVFVTPDGKRQTLNPRRPPRRPPGAPAPSPSP